MSNHCLYRVFCGNEKVPIYIGITRCALTRLASHLAEAPWRGVVTRVEIIHYSTSSEARRAEVEAIKNECPKFNIVHNLNRPHRMTTYDNPDRLISVKECARRMGVCVGTLIRWCDSIPIRHIRLQRNKRMFYWRYVREDLFQYAVPENRIRINKV